MTNQETDNESLLTAIVEGDLNTLDKLIESGIDVNQPVGKGWSPVYYAVSHRRGQEKIIERLAIAGSDLDGKGEYGRTALHKAVHWGLSGQVEVLLERGANINARDSNGRAPLILAVQENRADMVKLLTSRGADIGQLDDAGNSALTYAVDSGRDELIRHFQDLGAPAQNLNEMALIAAASEGRTPEVDALIRSGVNVNAANTSGNCTALMVAAAHEHADIVRALIEAGADVNLVSEGGTTALMEAALRGDLDIVRLLAEAGADIAYENQLGHTALAQAEANSKSSGHRSVAQYLRGKLSKAIDGEPKRSQKLDLDSPEMEGSGLLVNSGIESVAQAFVNQYKPIYWQRDVFDHEVEPGNEAYVLYQFSNQPWTVIVPLTRAGNVKLKALPLSQALKSKAIYFAVSDTAAAIAYAYYDSGQRIESMKSDDRGIRFSSTARNVGSKDIRNAQQFARDFLKAQSISIPPAAFLGPPRGRKRIKLTIPGFLPEDLVRMDQIAF